MKERVALFDIGSNSIRLVVLDIQDNYSTRELQNIKISARLFDYLEEDNTLNEEGVRELLRILSGMKKEALSMQAETFLLKATAAIRQAKNRDAIIQRVKEELDLTLDVISGEEEGRMGFNSVIHTFEISEGLSLDIGGGSSELTYFKDRDVVKIHSFPFGAVTLKDKFFEGKAHNDKKAIKEARAFIHKEFLKDDFFKDLKLPLYAIGGAARNLVRIYQFQKQYPMAGLHEFFLEPKEIEDLYALLKDSSTKELLNLDGLSDDRVDLILPATLIFLEVLEISQATEFRFSQFGLREGVMYQYIENHYHKPYNLERIQERSVEDLNTFYQGLTIPNAQRLQTVSLLLKAIDSLNQFKLSDKERRLVRLGAFIYQIGTAIEKENASEHTFYLLSNKNLPGFTHKERLALSLIASYKNKSLFKQYISRFEGWFSEETFTKIGQLGSLVKFADALNDTRNHAIQSLKFKKIEDNLLLVVSYNGELVSEITHAMDQKKHLERIFNKPISLQFIANS